MVIQWSEVMQDEVRVRRFIEIFVNLIQKFVEFSVLIYLFLRRNSI